MKNILITFFTLLLFSTLACSSRKVVSQVADAAIKEDIDTLAFDSILWNDSTVFSSESAARVQISCIFPYATNNRLSTADAMLMDSISCWICEQFNDTLHHDKKQIKELVINFGKAQLENDSKELKELQEDIHYANYEYESNIDIEFQNDEYITMHCMTYMYMAGAHGYTSQSYETFSKKDGHRCGWELVASLNKKELTEKIHEGLKDYFQVEGNTKAETDKALRALLFGNDEDGGMTTTVYHNDFPMPALPPYLTSKGITMIYQQYEIACYAAGMPTFTLK